jgi:hypothetical protein
LRTHQTVAKGNDGHYLQHSVEIAAAVRLASLSADRRIHILLTHGMAPFESCDIPAASQQRKLFYGALEDATKRPRPREPSLVTAYRATDASLQRYPNSAGLIASIIGRDRLTGEITEVDPKKHRQLKLAWSGSNVAAIKGSWRSWLTSDSTQSVSCVSPWLLSMDPMTYIDNECGDAADGNIYRDDRGRIAAIIDRLVGCNVPGIATIFSYRVSKHARPGFWAFVDGIADDTGAAVVSCWLPHQGGNRNLAALLCSGLRLAPDWLPVNLRRGRYDESGV